MAFSKSSEMSLRCGYACFGGKTPPRNGIVILSSILENAMTGFQGNPFAVFVIKAPNLENAMKIP